MTTPEIRDAVATPTPNPPALLPVIEPCPFCGGEAQPVEFQKVGSESRWHRVECDQCDAVGPATEGCSTTYFGARRIEECAQEAIAAWNTRQAPAEPKVSREAVIEVPIDADAAHWITLAVEFLDTAAGMEMEIEGYDAMEIVTGLHGLLDDDANRPFHEDVARWLKGKMRPTEPEELSNPPADGDGPADKILGGLHEALGHAQGFRAGVEAAAKVADGNRTDDDSMWDRCAETIARMIRNLAPPSAPLGAGGDE